MNWKLSEDKKEEFELEKIRMNKLKMMMEKQKMQEIQNKQKKHIYDKIDVVFRAILSPDAYNHLINLKNSDSKVYWAIFNTLVTPSVMERIDLLLMIIKERRSILKRMPLETIVYLERKFKGIKPSIQVKRRDEEAVDLSTYLK